MKLEIPKDVADIINKIYENNFEAYIVGGCVRDSLLDFIPHDYDITTNATPNEIINIFKDFKVLPTGIQHGTVTLIFNNNEYEITTYRIEGKYSDNRRPDEVSYSKDIYEDLKRRDFTINAMAYNQLEGIVDKFGGINDLKGKIIRCVGDSNKRFNEDALRMIRAIRFSAKLNFNIEENTFKNIYLNSALIKNISKERIRDEIDKIILSKDMKKINLIHDTKMIEHLDIKDKQIEKNKLNLFGSLTNDFNIRLTLYLANFYDKENSMIFLDKLKYSNKIKNYCQTMLDIIDENLEDNKENIKLKLNKIGYDKFKDLIYIKSILSNDNIQQVEKIKNIEYKLKEIKESNETYEIKDLKINGKDLEGIGYKGKNIGLQLNELLMVVIKDNNLNNKVSLMELAQINIQNYKI